MSLTACFCALFSLISMIFDIKREKVPNAWNLCGIFVAIVLFGFDFKRIWGALIPFGLLFGLFYFKMLGTGDIKVLMVLGYAMGWELIIRCIWYAFLIGAGISFVVLCWRCGVRQRFSYLFTYLKTILITKDVLPYLATKNTPENIHFTISIFGSVMLLMIKGGYL